MTVFAVASRRRNCQITFACDRTEARNSLRRQLLTGTIMAVATVLFHVAWLIGLIDVLEWAGSATAFPDRLNTFVVFGIAMLCNLTVHSFEAWFRALVYKRLDQFEDIATAMYFSVVTTTTLRYGDFTLSDRWRVLASSQAIGGLILFGASTAFLLEIIRRLFPSG